MATYLIFYQDAITDREGLSAYMKAAGPTLGGRPVTPRIVSESVQNLEGDWNPARVVMLEFPTKEDALAWYDSPEYAEARKQRFAASSGAGILVEGLPGQ